MVDDRRQGNDSQWRVSGGIGIPPAPSVGDQQVLTQGVGYPLRPVDGAFDERLDPILELLPPVSEGLFTTWHGDYTAGLAYAKGSIVRDGLWLMVSNQLTVERPAPQPDGDPEWALPDTPAWADQQNTSVVFSGHRYVFTESGWLRGVRIWVNELTGDTNYRIIIVDTTDPNNPKYTNIEEPVLNLDDWTILGAFNRIVTAGTELLVYIDGLNSGGTTPVTGGWTFQGQFNNVNPPAQNWNHNTQHTEIRIDKTDLDSTDRTTELSGMVPGTTIQFAETGDPSYSFSYLVNGAPVDQGSAFSYVVALSGTGANGGPRAGNPTTMTADVPVAQPTKYVELAAGVPTPTWATVTGYLAYNGVDQGGGANGYGVDVNFQPATTSAHWDIMSYSGD